MPLLLCQTSWHLFVRQAVPLANQARDKHPPYLVPFVLHEKRASSVRREGPLASKARDEHPPLRRLLRRDEKGRNEV